MQPRAIAGSAVLLRRQFSEWSRVFLLHVVQRVEVPVGAGDRRGPMYHSLIIAFAVNIGICKVDSWLDKRLTDNILLSKVKLLVIFEFFH